MNQQTDETSQANVPPPASSVRWYQRVRLRTWIILLVVLLVVVSPALYRQYRINQVPLIPEPFDVAEFLEAHRVSDDENSLVEYQEAIKLYVMKPEWSPLVTFVAGATDPNPLKLKWKDAPQIAKDAIAANDESLEKWLQGSRKPKFCDISLAEIQPDQPLSELTELQKILKFAFWKQSQLQDEGRLDESWEIILGGYRTAVQLMNEGLLIERLIGNNCHQHFIAHQIRWSEDPRLDSVALQSALSELQKVHDSILPFAHNVKTEYCLMRIPIVEIRRNIDAVLNQSNRGYKTISQQIDEWFQGPGTDIYFGLTGEYGYIDRLRRHIFANRIAHVDDARQVREKLKKYSRSVPFFQDDSPAGPELPSHEIQRLADETLDLSAYDFGLDRHLDSCDRNEAAWGAAELILALQIYYRDKGEFPAELQQLVPEYLEKLPPNPYADELDGTLLYRRESDHVVLWMQGAYEPRSPGEEIYFVDRGGAGLDSLFWTVYPPGTRPPLYRPLPDETEPQGEEVSSGEGK